MQMSDHIVEDVADVDLRDLVLPMFVLYEHPKDFPDKIVVRVWDMDKPTNVICLFDNVIDAKDAMSHFTFLSRNPDDDPVILGSYV